MISDKPTAEFNSSIDYLRRIGWLVSAYHQACVETEGDYHDDWLILNQLHQELDPRMNADERIASEDLMRRSKARPCLIRDYFLVLYRFAHKEGLIMKDSDNLPGVIRG